jgi:hypothetical protein
MNKKASKLLRKISSNHNNYRKLKKIYNKSSWFDKTKILKGIREGIQEGKEFMGRFT